MKKSGTSYRKANRHSKEKGRTWGGKNDWTGLRYPPMRKGGPCGTCVALAKSVFGEKTYNREEEIFGWVLKKA